MKIKKLTSVASLIVTLSVSPSTSQGKTFDTNLASHCAKDKKICELIHNPTNFENYPSTNGKYIVWHSPKAIQPKVLPDWCYVTTWVPGQEPEECKTTSFPWSGGDFDYKVFSEDQKKLDELEEYQKAYDKWSFFGNSKAGLYVPDVPFDPTVTDPPPPNVASLPH